MSDFVTEYGKDLCRAAWRLREARGGNRFGSRRRALVVAVLLVAVAAPATAATGVWRPLLGDGSREGPTPTSSRAPADQRALLGVLRRPQQPSDRGPQTDYALKFLTRGVGGVRVADIRLLHAGAGAVVLIPVARFGLESAHGAQPLGAARTGSNGLCLFAADTQDGRADGGGFGCYTTAEISRGRATASVGSHVYGLVPDGVRTVQVKFSDGGVSEATVDDNLFAYSAPASGLPGAIVRDATWYDGAGVRVRTVPGTSIPSPTEVDPATSLCDPAVPRDRCMSGNYAGEDPR